MVKFGDKSKYKIIYLHSNHIAMFATMLKMYGQVLIKENKK